VGELAGEGAFEGMRRMEGDRYDARCYEDENCVTSFKKKQKYLTHHNNFL